MTQRKPPDESAQNPVLVRAMSTALEHSVLPSETLTSRLAAQGRLYHIGTRFTITTAQGSAYLYVDNSANDVPFVVESDEIKVSGGNALAFVRDEPTLDETTFDPIEFKNYRSDVTPGPDSTDAYFGFDSDVSITDKGRIFDDNFIKASSGTVGNTSTGTGRDGTIAYAIGAGSTGILEIQNDSSNEIEVSISTNFHELPPVPDIVQD